MNYHDLKIIHIFVAMLTIALSSALFFSEGAKSKSHKIALGMSSLLLLLTGFSIMGRFGLSHAPPYPTWIIVKISMWLVLTVATPIVVKRYPEKAKRLFWPWMLIALIAVSMAIYKPM